MVTSTTLYDEYARRLDLDSRATDSLWNKAKICAYLVCCGASVELESYPLHDKDFRTGNAGLQLSVGSSHLRALIPFMYMDDGNPVRVRGDYLKKTAVIAYAGRELFEVSIIPDAETGNEHINLEFDTVIAAIPDEPHGVRSCQYHITGKPCAFCILDTRSVDLGPEDLATAYEKVTGERGIETQVLLTGGTSGAEDRGLEKYVPYVRELRSVHEKARIAVEAAPPQDPRRLDALIDLGLDTFAANIEFYSQTCRNSLLPGKSAIPLQEYADSFAYCRSAGVRTFSAVIAGPEEEQDTLNGVEFLARVGVPSNLLCLRPFPGARLESCARVDPAWFFELTRKAVRIMDDYGVLEDLAGSAGCGSCGACAMEMNLYRLAREGGADYVLDPW
jgi:hypothetical protein